MIPSEVTPILARFVAAFPSSKADEATAVVWAESLATIDADIGLAAARALVTKARWFPTLVEFHAECRVQKARRDGPRRVKPRAANWREVGAAGLASARDAMRGPR